MKDGSRVVVVRPSMSETWAFFVRKFDVKRATVEQWTGEMPGSDKVIDLLKFLVKGARITSITGEQGCGKTTLLMGMIENIYETIKINHFILYFVFVGNCEGYGGTIGVIGYTYGKN